MPSEATSEAIRRRTESFLFAEILNNPLLVHIRNGAVQDLHLFVLELKIPFQMLMQEMECFNPFRENDKPVLFVFAGPSIAVILIPNNRKQFLVFWKTVQE